MHFQPKEFGGGGGGGRGGRGEGEGRVVFHAVNIPEDRGGVNSLGQFFQSIFCQCGHGQHEPCQVKVGIRPAGEQLACQVKVGMRPAGEQIACQVKVGMHLAKTGRLRKSLTMKELQKRGAPFVSP